VAGQVHVDIEDAIGWIVLDQPERRNAISVDMWQAIPDAVRRVAGDRDVRVVVLRGAGDIAFAAGADISEFERARTGASVDEYDDDSGRAIAALVGLDKPLVAMIHGFCIGGGCTIALTADLRYASDDARFAIPAARLGLGYAPGGIERLMSVVGPSSAKELFFTARRFSAHEALTMGLVNAVHRKADLETHVRSTARQIAANAPMTVASVKLIVDEVCKPADRRDHAAMAASVKSCFESDDYREGVRAFLEKRDPNFGGT
jgi:enoyl-CoA hydratase/carnithine racemase